MSLETFFFFSLPKMFFYTTLKFKKCSHDNKLVIIKGKKKKKRKF